MNSAYYARFAVCGNYKNQISFGFAIILLSVFFYLHFYSHLHSHLNFFLTSSPLISGL